MRHKFVCYSSSYLSMQIICLWCKFDEIGIHCKLDRQWHTSRKSHYLRSKKKNCEALKGWDIKIIPMNMENPNIALFFFISGWTIQCHKKKCPKTLFWTIFTPKTHLSLNGESWKLVCICNGVPSVCVPKIMRIGQFKGTQKWLKLAKICK